MNYEELNNIIHFDEAYTGDMMHMQRLDNAATRNMSTDNMQIHRAYIGLDEHSPFQGYIIAVLQYGDSLYRLYYRICQPTSTQDIPELDYQMHSLEQYTISEYMGIPTAETMPTTLGTQAFWDDTPIDSLDEYGRDAYELRRLMNNIEAYAKNNKLKQKIRGKVHAQ